VSYHASNYPRRAANPELAAPGDGFEPIRAIHEWLLGNAAVAWDNLQQRIYDERRDEQAFLDGAFAYAGIRWGESKGELVGRFEALQSVARLMGFNIPANDEAVAS